MTTPTGEVFVLTLNGVVLGVYANHADAENARRFDVHETKQKDATVTQCVVRTTRRETL